MKESRDEIVEKVIRFLKEWNGMKVGPREIKKWRSEALTPSKLKTII